MWFGCWIRNPPGCLTFNEPHATVRRPQGRPSIQWRDYVSCLAIADLWSPQDELEGVGREAFVLPLLGLLPPKPRARSAAWMNGVPLFYSSYSSTPKFHMLCMLESRRHMLCLWFLISSAPFTYIPRQNTAGFFLMT